ncbi:uroporphyrinogen decarboxylase family protein [Thermodesulfobacteriota bacterium]
MNSRERVLAAAAHEPVDRAPVFLWLNSHAAMKMTSRLRWSRNPWITLFAMLADRIHTTKRDIPSDLRDGLPIVFQLHADYRYNLELGSDVALVHPMHWTMFPYRIWKDDNRIQFRDFFGTVRGIRGLYIEMIRPAIETPYDLLTYRFPDCNNDAIWAPIRKYRARHPDVAIVSETWGVQDITATGLWKMDDFMMALYEHPEKVKVFFDKLEAFSINMIRKGVQAGSDIVMIYDDYGTQHGPQISVDMWREFTYPHLKKLIEVIHDHGAKAMLHSCGNQMSYLPHYVEAELDILQSFQLSAGNDFIGAKKKFGRDLCFATGIDVQTLERMSPEEVRQSILENYRIGRDGGGFILATTHMLQPTMPLKNMRAVVSTLEDLRRGEIQ